MEITYAEERLTIRNEHYHKAAQGQQRTVAIREEYCFLYY